MKTEKLFELLTMVDGVTFRKWDMVMKLVNDIRRGVIEVKHKKWNDDYKNNSKYYPLNLEDIKTWSTYDDTCIDLVFTNNTPKDNGHPNNQLVCKVKIYEGSGFDGSRKDLRFEALLYLPTAFIHEIENYISWAFDEYLEYEYENHLKLQKQLWINKFREKVLET